MKKAYQLSPEWDKLIKKDTANKNLWDQVKEIEVFTRKEFLDKVNKLAVLGIRDILVRIWIRGSVPLTNGSGSNSGPDSFLCDFKNAKQKFLFFSFNLNGGTFSLKMYFCAKIEKERIRIRTSD